MTIYAGMIVLVSGNFGGRMPSAACTSTVTRGALQKGRQGSVFLKTGHAHWQLGLSACRRIRHAMQCILQGVSKSGKLSRQNHWKREETRVSCCSSINPNFKHTPFRITPVVTLTELL